MWDKARTLPDTTLLVIKVKEVLLLRSFNVGILLKHWFAKLKKDMDVNCTFGKINFRLENTLEVCG